MGALALPKQGLVYLDANSIIYAVELIEPYQTILRPLWEGARTGVLSVATSDLTLLEILVKPLKIGNKGLEADCRALLDSPDVRLISISHAVLEHAASLRATTSVKTPDAIHAATALIAGCELFVTNDSAFKKIPGLPVALLSEIILSP
ncbi:MAG TPA: PIN domain-containing protein [Ktedonobacterales bacterium]